MPTKKSPKKKTISDLLPLLETLRAMPQYGYVLAGVQKSDMSTIADHSYLVSMTAWIFARGLEREGIIVSIERVLELSLVHDLGELLGGDVNFYYGRMNTKARALSREFEKENFYFLSKLFGEDERYVQELWEELMAMKTLESQVAKLADYIECAEYKAYMKVTAPEDFTMAIPIIKKILGQVKNAKAKKALEKIVTAWARGYGKTRAVDALIRVAKNEKVKKNL